MHHQLREKQASTDNLGFPIASFPVPKIDQPRDKQDVSDIEGQHNAIRYITLVFNFHIHEFEFQELKQILGYSLIPSTTDFVY
jgi:hypothetical protein